MAVSKALRYQILRRDNHTCRYCGRSAPEVKLAIDHVVPETLGGTDDPTNLTTACADCNNGKSATPPDAAHVAQVADDAVRWAEAMREAAAGMLDDLDARKSDRDRFLAAWDRWGMGEGDDRRPIPLSPEWSSTIDRFVAAGLPLEVLIDSIDIAMTRKSVPAAAKFNYLCGIGWNRVTELQAAARQHLTGGCDAAAFDWNGAAISESGVAIDRDGNVYDFADHQQHPACTAYARRQFGVALRSEAWLHSNRIGQEVYEEAADLARLRAGDPLFAGETDEVVRFATAYITVLANHVEIYRAHINDLLNTMPSDVEARVFTNADKHWHEFVMRVKGKHEDPPHVMLFSLLLRGLGEVLTEHYWNRED